MIVQRTGGSALLVAADVLLGMCAAFGAAAVLGALALLTGFVHRHTLRRGRLAQLQAAVAGEQWALITGASDGIGAALARQLAKEGMNVVLLARSLKKLEAVRSACVRAGAKATVIPFDFAAATADDYAALREQLGDLRISLLVNNVGVNFDFPTDFLDADEQLQARIVQLNIAAALEMTRMLLPPMLAQSGGLVIFLSSANGTVFPGCKFAPYAGSKAFVDAFATALHGEVAARGVRVQSMRAFFVVSPMSKISRPSLTVPTANAWAAAALRAMGHEVQCTPYWSHELMAAMLQLLPLSWKIRYANRVQGNVRQRALRKLARQQKAQ